MKFLELLSSKLNEFLGGFQTDQPMFPFLAETFEKKQSSTLPKAA